VCFFHFGLVLREIGLRTGETERDPNSNMCVCVCVCVLQAHTHTHTHNLAWGFIVTDVIRWERRWKIGRWNGLMLLTLINVNGRRGNYQRLVLLK